MTFSQIVAALNADVLNEGNLGPVDEILDAVACDLMSDVLTIEKENFLLITSLCSEQTARTAEITGARCIALTSGRRPQPNLLGLARENRIALITTSLSTLAACYRIGALLALEGRSM